ncbi:MAG TPA: hypothetical protein VGO93_17665 [Candidatus Xenobia bacterium]|jgi:hypothetical protein
MESLPTLVAFGLVVVGLVAGTLWYLRRMAQTALNPRFTWLPLDPARGEAVDVTVEVEASQAVHVRDVEAHLVGTRYAYPPPNQSNGGIWALEADHPYGTPEKDCICHNKVLLCHAMMFQQGEPVKLMAQLDVPGDALPSKTSGRLQIHWALQIRFDIVNFPPLVLERSLEVLHEPRQRPAHCRAMEAPTPPPGLELESPARPKPASRWSFSKEPDPPAPPSKNGDTLFAHLELDSDRPE